MTHANRVQTTALADLATGRVYEVLRQARIPKDSVQLTVVIPSFNTVSYVASAIQSVLTQTWRALEVIVVDDGSSDGSVDAVLAIEDPRLTCVRQANRGLAGARNTGLLLARGPFVGFLDSDDIWFPNKAARHLALMAEDRSVGLTFSHSAYLDESGVPTGQLLIAGCARPTARDFVKRNHAGNGSTAIIRLACLEAAGGFDEAIKNCEEWELWVRLTATTPFEARLVSEVLTGYRIREDSLSVTFDHFLTNGDLAVDRFHNYVPGFSRAQARQARAQNRRVASRKALSSGQPRLSRRLLFEALRQYPLLPLVDARAAVLTIIHGISWPLSDRGTMAVYRAVRGLMKTMYARWSSDRVDFAPAAPGGPL
jgi:glycosyltransferase involved in cell wall biosynthesis